MKISTKGDYGIRALIELAHRYGEKRPTQSGDIAARQSIPESYLEQLLTTLRRAGFVRSVRGPQGGHVLARRPSEIAVSNVIEALEGPIIDVDCLNHAGNCATNGGCAQSEMWAAVREAVLGVLTTTTIADLAERDRMAQPAGSRYII
ncbi:MAG TPA: Rrf2 family transcriptional regulator [Dehalococcoidia bacterium]|nr:Rrf2 family transcriptional regulator [Dehalococcoidia bacterium]